MSRLRTSTSSSFPIRRCAIPSPLPEYCPAAAGRVHGSDELREKPASPVYEDADLPAARRRRPDWRAASSSRQSGCHRQSRRWPPRRPSGSSLTMAYFVPSPTFSVSTASFRFSENRSRPLESITCTRNPSRTSTRSVVTPIGTEVAALGDAAEALPCLRYPEELGRRRPTSKAVLPPRRASPSFSGGTLHAASDNVSAQ